MYLPTSSAGYPTLVLGAQAFVADYQNTGERAHYICDSFLDDVATWKFLYIDAVTPAIASVSNTGIVLGSIAPGQIYVESDGKMSLNGYDTLVQSISQLSTQVTQLFQDISSQAGTVTQIQIRQSLTRLMDILPSLPQVESYQDNDKVFVPDGLVLVGYVKSPTAHPWVELT